MKIKHKWWKHLFYKYKVVETEKTYHEYEAFRLWTVIAVFILMIFFSPIIVAFFAVEMLKGATEFPEGQDGREEYYIYDKEEIDNREKQDE